MCVFSLITSIHENGEKNNGDLLCQTGEIHETANHASTLIIIIIIFHKRETKREKFWTCNDNIIWFNLTYDFCVFFFSFNFVSVTELCDFSDQESRL